MCDMAYCDREIRNGEKIQDHGNGSLEQGPKLRFLDRDMTVVSGGSESVSGRWEKVPNL